MQAKKKLRCQHLPGFTQSHDNRGEKGRGRVTGQRRLCSTAAHAEGEGQARKNDENCLAQRHSRNVACISQYGLCMHVVAWWGMCSASCTRGRKRASKNER